MNTIAILPEGGDAHPATFRAITTDRKATGRTPGEALDALTSQLGAESAGAAVILQLFRPDTHFSAEQRDRLSTLMERWRAARETGSTLPLAEQIGLERLIDEELQGSAERAAQMSRELETARGPRRRRLGQKGAELWVIFGVGIRLAKQLYVTRFLINLLGTLVVVGVFILDLKGALAGGRERALKLYAIVALTALLTNLYLHAADKLIEVIDRRAHAKFQVRRDAPEDPADASKQKELTGAR